jgi:hypothetical protein
MEQRQAIEVQLVVGAVGAALQQAQRALAGALQIGLRARGVRQAELPAPGMRHLARVVQRIGTGTLRRRMRAARIGRGTAPTLRVAPDPVLLEPADVAQLPQRRVELGRLWHGHRLRAQRLRGGVELAQQPLTRIGERRGQHGCGSMSYRFGIVDGGGVSRQGRVHR